MRFSKAASFLFFCLAPAHTVGFAPVPSILGSGRNNAISISLSSTENDLETTTNTQSSDDINDDMNMNSKVSVPLTLDEMITQSSEAMRQAKQKGINRQIIRIFLPRDSKSGQLGQYFENDMNEDRIMSRSESSTAFSSDSESSISLVPPDETWQGGIMQLYRAAAPTVKSILRKVSGDVGGVPAKLIEDRSIDTSGVDGVGLWMSQNNDPKDDVSCFVQPLQETVDVIESISNQAGKRTVVLVNPQWRNVDDALDSASKSGGVFGTLASFLGGKGGSLQRLDDLGYQSVYSIEGYVCKGGNVRLMKRFDSDWVVFAENDSETSYIKIGEVKGSRPSYQDVDKMLDDKGISLKYARDIGLAPKLE
mmetsp:Transcript_21062/g.23924  ORF Transcript_21062/g.23924 Transcript_21062/m.23924 type:complete len:365 (+) Transcript_21062:131-1225(+)